MFWYLHCILRGGGVFISFFDGRFVFEFSLKKKKEESWALISVHNIM